MSRFQTPEQRLNRDLERLWLEEPTPPRLPRAPLPVCTAYGDCPTPDALLSVVGRDAGPLLKLWQMGNAAD